MCRHRAALGQEEGQRKSHRDGQGERQGEQAEDNAVLPKAVELQFLARVAAVPQAGGDGLPEGLVVRHAAQPKALTVLVEQCEVTRVVGADAGDALDVAELPTLPRGTGAGLETEALRRHQDSTAHPQGARVETEEARGAVDQEVEGDVGDCKEQDQQHQNIADHQKVELSKVGCAVGIAVVEQRFSSWDMCAQILRDHSGSHVSTFWILGSGSSFTHKW